MENLDSFLFKTTQNIDEKYCNGDFEEGYQQAIETFENAIIDFFKRNNPELICKVIEYDTERDDCIELMTNICESIKDYKLENFFTTGWNDSYFCILLLKK